MAIKQNTAANENIAVILPYDTDGEFFVEDLGELKAKPFYSFIKRLGDIVFSLFALVVLAIPMGIIALLVRFTSEGEVLYHQERLGLNGKKIDVVKFRTMYKDAEAKAAQWSRGDKDPRITPIGRILRKTHMDEYPQFLSILKGEMSLIGPRPEREIFYDKFEQYIHGFHERLKVKPGLTGLAQINGGYHLSPEQKVAYDVEYIKNRSIGNEIKIFFKTIMVLFVGKDAK